MRTVTATRTVTTESVLQDHVDYLDQQWRSTKRQWKTAKATLRRLKLDLPPLPDRPEDHIPLPVCGCGAGEGVCPVCGRDRLPF